MLAEGSPGAVLVADADTSVSRVISAGLSANSAFRVTSTARGRDALSASLRSLFNVVLWDLRLPDTQHALPLVRAVCPAASLILMSTDDHLHISSDLALLDVHSVLVKPFGIDALLASVANALDSNPMALSAGSLEFLQTGQRITVISDGGRCQSRVYLVEKSRFTVIGAPRVETPTDFMPGIIVQAEVPGLDAIYQFRTRLLTQLEQPTPCWEMTMPRSIARKPL